MSLMKEEACQLMYYQYGVVWNYDQEVARSSVKSCNVHTHHHGVSPLPITCPRECLHVSPYSIFYPTKVFSSWEKLSQNPAFIYRGWFALLATHIFIVTIMQPCLILAFSNVFALLLGKLQDE